MKIVFSTKSVIRGLYSWDGGLLRNHMVCEHEVYRQNSKRFIFLMASCLIYLPPVHSFSTLQVSSRNKVSH